MFHHLIVLASFVSPHILTTVYPDWINFCSKNEFSCTDGACVSLDRRCDGARDCADGSDEGNCTSSSNQLDLQELVLHRYRRQSGCRKNQWRCRDGTCIPVDGKCDGVVDCPDASDETHLYCRNVRCQSNLFRCSYGACVDGTAPCSGAHECVDGSDELLPRCRNELQVFKGKFTCKSGEKISSTDLCNGEKNCADGSDETLESCAGRRCAPYQFQCAYGACVEADAECNEDGTQHCADGSDESDELCNRQTNTPTKSTNQGPQNSSLGLTLTIRTTTTEYIPRIADYNTDVTWNSKCAPVPQNLTVKTGSKAFDKCIEYQEQVVYPCERGVDYMGELRRGNYCLHNVDELFVGGKDAKRNEFPHMALLTYGDGAFGSIICGGTVISENFVLTAGHCSYAPNIGPVTSVKVGFLRVTEDVPSHKVHRVKRIIRHPQYKPPSKYHDIALLETETAIILDLTTIPACLDIGDTVDDSRAAATGWGYYKGLEEVLDVLKKVTLHKFTPQECTAEYKSGRYLKSGYDERTQLCYGDPEGTKDTVGNSGCPLLINNPRIHCMYTVIGVTSFGKHGGLIGVPSVYTRVSSYTRWIESVVWP